MNFSQKRASWNQLDHLNAQTHLDDELIRCCVKKVAWEQRYFMYKKNSLNDWKWYFEDKGIPSDLIEDYLIYIRALNKNNVPVIFELEHMSYLLGLQLNTVSSMIFSPTSFYRSFNIPKKRGGTRRIDAPYPSLLYAQKWIYTNILSRVDVDSSAHGYVCGRSIVSNAKEHVAKRCFLKIDLKDFFPSIKKNWVINIFRELGYAKNVSFYLGSLCCYEDYLVQGAATSPAISNIICRNLDCRLRLIASSYGLVYTRYADDIAMSGDYIPNALIGIISRIIEEEGFQTNKEKTFLDLKGNKRILTGISISGDRIKLPRSYKREIKKEAHYLLKFGFFSHVSKKKIKDPFYLESVYGKLCFWMFVEPDNKTAKFYASEIKALMSEIGSH